MLLCVKNSFITESFLNSFIGQFEGWQGFVKAFVIDLPFGAGGIHRQRRSLIQCNKRSSVFGKRLGETTNKLISFIKNIME